MQISWYSLFFIFLVGSFLGDLVETFYCRLTGGKWMRRSSLVWGPFSIVWGLGCAGLTALLYRHRHAGVWRLFILGTVLGGIYEYLCSVFTEFAFGTVFWDYSHIPFNIGGRINLLYCFFWGIAAVLWFRWIYPPLSYGINRFLMKYGKRFSNLFLVFMLTNIALSASALGRYRDRQKEVPAKTGAGIWLDKHFPDERIEALYPNLILR